MDQVLVCKIDFPLNMQYANTMTNMEIANGDAGESIFPSPWSNLR